ncbi:MAG TPA: hypothetical protein VGM56_14250, partial [Byssovorax sp.]
MLAALGPPGADDDGRSREVDLDRAWFSAGYDGTVEFAGPCQLVAILTEHAWRWGFDDPAVPPRAVGNIRALVQSDAALAALGASPLVLPDDAFALRLATWLALRAGFLGAYPVVVRGVATLMALGISRPSSAGAPTSAWCSACGGAADDLGIVDEDLALCAACVDELRALGEPHPTDRRRVVFEGTLRTPRDLVTLQAAFGSSSVLALTGSNGDRASAAGVLEALRALCLVCGRSRSPADVLVLNDAFTICPKC